MLKKDIQDIAALSPIQQGMLFHYLNQPDSDAYFEQLSLTIDGEIDNNRFTQAWQTVVQKNGVLRTCFKWESLEKPVQLVLKHHEPDIRFSHSQEDPDLIKQNDRRNRFNLTQVPFRITLCTLNSGTSELIISHHHILFDGWSTGILLKEFFNAYRSPANLPVTKTPYTHYVKWLQQQDQETWFLYWSEYLEGIEHPSRLSIKGGYSNSEPGTPGFRAVLEPTIAQRLSETVHAHKQTLASVIYTAWGLVYSQYNNSEDVMFGTTVSGRNIPLPGIENTAGLFINTIPLRLRLAAGGHESVAELSQRLHIQLKNRQPYENTPPLKIREAGPLGPGEELYDSIVVIENYPLQKVLFQNGSDEMLRVSGYEIYESTHYPLSVGVTLLDDIEIDIQAAPGAFSNLTVQQIGRHFVRAIEQIVTGSTCSIQQLDILSQAEKSQILNEFNNTSTPYPEEKTIHSIFEEQVEKTPDAVAVSAPIDKSSWTFLTYKQLNHQADCIAGKLRGCGAVPGSIIAIQLQRSLELIITILAILKTHSAYLPIDPKYPKDRIDYMLRDSSASFLIHNASGEPSPLERGGIPAPYRGSYAGVCPGQVPCYIIYTSGTTGQPKGVLVNHSSVLNRLFWLKDNYQLTPRDIVLQATSFIFDVSVCELFRWIPAGGRLCFLSPDGHKDPAIITHTIARQNTTTADFVPAVLDMVLQYIEENRKVTDISSLRYVFTGVEAVGAALVQRFNRLLFHTNNTVLINAYGPTESTVDVTHFICSGSAFDQHVSRCPSIPIGKPIGNVRIYILDRCRRLQPTGAPGELCIGGKGLARGYLNNQELTAERFENYTLDHFNPNPKTPSPYPTHITIYRTGDLARWLEDGNIEFLGRLDRQVKVRGFRVELAEIESRLLTHPVIDHAHVHILKPDSQDTELCAYLITSQEIEEQAIRQFLAAYLPYYMIPAYFVFLESMPLTPSGKIDRTALPQPEYNERSDRYNAPRNIIETQLLRLYSTVLEKEPTGISIDDNFFRLGGHSLKAMSLTALIQKTFNVHPPVSQIFETPDIRSLAQYIRNAAGEALSDIPAVEEKEYYPLSSAQKRMFILQGMDKKNTNYNMPDAVLLEGSVDIDRFGQIFQQMIQRHESLRTSFFIVQHQPVQRIFKQVDFQLELDTLNDIDDLATENTTDTEKSVITKILERFVRPFDLARPPLMRAKLVKLDDTRHYLLVDMFHIIADGVSIGIFIRDFMALYSNQSLPDLHIQYKDFARWQNALRQNPSFKEKQSWWLKEFDTMPPPLTLPLDFPRPPNQGFDGGFTHFHLDRETTAALKNLAAEQGASLFMVLLSAYYILLWKLGGNQDIVVGSPIAGRNQYGLEGIMGMFVNTLPLRNTIEPDETFPMFLQRVKAKTLSAYENQDYQFEDLVEQLSIQRDPARHPVFDVVFALHNVEISDIRIPGLNLALMDYARDIALFDFYLEAEEKKEALAFKASYCSGLFNHETIETYVRYYRQIIDALLHDKHIVLNDINISHDLLEPESDKIEEALGDFGF